MHTASPSYPSSIIVLYDTTTTEIHTLSLHDALPISPATLSLLTTMFPEGRERTRALGLYTAVSVGGVSFGLVAGGILTELASDRKSTRLNSSHSSISYAVFCLKKKKAYHLVSVGQVT